METEIYLNDKNVTNRNKIIKKNAITFIIFITPFSILFPIIFYYIKLTMGK